MQHHLQALQLPKASAACRCAGLSAGKIKGFFQGAKCGYLNNLLKHLMDRVTKAWRYTTTHVSINVNYWGSEITSIETFFHTGPFFLPTAELSSCLGHWSMEILAISSETQHRRPRTKTTKPRYSSSSGLLWGSDTAPNTLGGLYVPPTFSVSFQLRTALPPPSMEPGHPPPSILPLCSSSTSRFTEILDWGCLHSSVHLKSRSCKNPFQYKEFPIPFFTSAFVLLLQVMPQEEAPTGRGTAAPAG